MPDTTLHPKIFFCGGSATVEGARLAMDNAVTQAKSQGYTEKQLCPVWNTHGKYW